MTPEPSNAPLYRLEVRSTNPAFNGLAWRESTGTKGGPGVPWALAARMSRHATVLTAQCGYADMLYRVVQA